MQSTTDNLLLSSQVFLPFIQAMKMDKTISTMIIEYCKKLVSQGINIANVGQNVVKVNGDESNNEKEYIDLDIVGIVMV